MRVYRGLARLAALAVFMALQGCASTSSSVGPSIFGIRLGDTYAQAYRRLGDAQKVDELYSPGWRAYRYSLAGGSAQLSVLVVRGHVVAIDLDQLNVISPKFISDPFGVRMLTDRDELGDRRGQPVGVDDQGRYIDWWYRENGIYWAYKISDKIESNGHHWKFPDYRVIGWHAILRRSYLDRKLGTWPFVKAALPIVHTGTSATDAFRFSILTGQPMSTFGSTSSSERAATIQPENGK